MPLLAVAKFFSAVLSLIVIAAAAWLLWSWWRGAWVPDLRGGFIHVRPMWRLWAGLGLGLWSILGRLVVLPLLGKPGGARFEPHGAGERLTGRSGSTLWVEALGPQGGPTLILTHGWGMDSTFWTAAKRELAGEFRLVLWDLPGLGRSKLPSSGRVEMSAFAADLAGLTESLGGERPVLVGHSIGGMTIQTLVRDHPELAARLGGIVLLDTTYTNPLATMALSGLAQALRPLLEMGMRLVIWLQPLVWLSSWQGYLSGSTHLAMRVGFGRRPTMAQIDHAALLSTRNPPAVQARGNLAMFRWDASHALEGLATPVLVVAGDADVVTKPQANERIAAEAGRGRFHAVSGANHMGPMEQAKVYNALIAEFARSQRMAAPAPMSARSGRSTAPAGAPWTAAARPTTSAAG